MAENNIENPLEIEDNNIFEGFSSDEELLQDVDEFEKNEKKDVYDHANLVGNILKIGNIVLVFILLFIFGYIQIQNSKEMTSSPLLEPICPILLGDLADTQSECSSVTSSLASIEGQLTTLKRKQFNAIADIIQPLYLSTDFINSSEVVFLLDHTQKRLKPMAILEEFDSLKNEFESEDKSALGCYNIEIKNNIMSAKCEVYSSDWDPKITLPSGASGGRIGGTSISIASSFLDFIERNSQNLRLLNKPKQFSSENVSGENGSYTKKTTFFLELEYSNDNLTFN